MEGTRWNVHVIHPIRQSTVFLYSYFVWHHHPMSVAVDITCYDVVCQWWRLCRLLHIKIVWWSMTMHFAKICKPHIDLMTHCPNILLFIQYISTMGDRNPVYICINLWAKLSMRLGTCPVLLVLRQVNETRMPIVSYIFIKKDISGQHWMTKH